MCKCGNERCMGFFLFHPKEIQMGYVTRAKQKELSENPNVEFVFMDSPSSGEIFTKFKELHVLMPKGAKNEKTDGINQ